MKPNRFLIIIAAMAILGSISLIAAGMPDGGVTIPAELAPLPVADVGAPLPVAPPVPVVAPAPAPEPLPAEVPVVEPVPLRDAIGGILALLLTAMGGWVFRRWGIRIRAELLTLLAERAVYAAEEYAARESAAGRKLTSQEKLAWALATLRSWGVAGEIAVTLIDAALGRAAGLGASGHGPR